MNPADSKFFAEVVTSTVWMLPYPHRIVWITILCAVNKHGLVISSIPGLARVANVSIAECEAAIAAFNLPSSFDVRLPEKGQRLKEVDGGWEVIGYTQLLGDRRDAERREQVRRAQSKQRAKDKANGVVRPKRVRHQPSSTSDDALKVVQQTLLPDPPPASKPPVPARNDGIDFVDWFLILLNKTGGRMPVLTDSITANWAKIYEQMLDIDKRSPEEIKKVCIWAREDKFWCTNFLSPVKLRDRKDGVQYFDIFLAKMKVGGGRKPAFA